MGVVHRVFVSSEERTSGDRTDFAIDTSGDFARFEGSRVMCAVEFCDVVRYSSEGGYGASGNNPSGLLLECPDVRPSNSYESWSGNTSCALALLQGYATAGLYGVAHDLPYCRGSHMGLEVDRDHVKRLGGMRFRLRRLCDADEEGDMRLAGEIAGAAIEAFAFQLVFFEPPTGLVEQPASYDFYRVWLSSKDREAGGEWYDCRIPVLLNASRSVDTSRGEWRVALENCTPLFSDAEGSDLPASLVLACPTLIGSEDRHILAHLGRSFRTGEEGSFGQRYSAKPLARDTVGHELRTSIDSLSSIHLRVLATPAMAPPGDAETYYPNYVASLVFYRTK